MKGYDDDEDNLQDERDEWKQRCEEHVAELVALRNEKNALWDKLNKAEAELNHFQGVWMKRGEELTQERDALRAELAGVRGGAGSDLRSAINDIVWDVERVHLAREPAVDRLLALMKRASAGDGRGGGAGNTAPLRTNLSRPHGIMDATWTNWQERAERAEAVLATAGMAINDYELDYWTYVNWKKWREGESKDQEHT